MRALTIAVLAALSAGGAAQAASLVSIGKGPAASCYEMAKARLALRDAVAACDLALTAEPLTNRDRAATYVNRGILLQIAGNVRGALSDFESAAEIRPLMAEIYVNQGFALVKAERDQEALAAFDRALSLDPQDPAMAYYGRGAVHELSGNLKAAYNDYRKAVELAPQWDKPRAMLSRFQIKTSGDGRQEIALIAN